LGQCISQRVSVPTTFWQRAKGLLGKNQIDGDECYLFYDCNSVHMFGMKFSLDLVYLNKELKIIKLVSSLQPWQISACLKGKHVLEMRAGSIEFYSLWLGQKLFLKESCE
jgi:hypothetical protein